MDIANRIRIVRGEQTREQFSQITGIHPQTLYKYENKTGKVSLESLEIICKKFNIRYEWLITGEGPMLQDQQPPKDNVSPCVVDTAHSDVDIIMIPMAEARLSAGCGSLEVDANSERKYGFRSDFLFRKGSPNDMILMRVSGDSMAPEIEDNDVVLLDQSRKEITPGRLYAVGFEEAIYLKRIDMLPGKVILKSTNPLYPPVELDINGDCEDLFRVIGRVLWCGREYK